MNNFNKYKNTKVLITGSTGFKGSWLSLWLYNLGAKVYGLALRPNKNSVLFNKLKLNKKIKQYYCDINNYNKTHEIIKKIKPDIIFHLAAQSLVSESILNPLDTIKTNIYGSSVILKSYYLNNCNAMVFCTSDKCYKNNEWIWGYKENDAFGGEDPYSASKASAELIFHSFLRSYNFNEKKTKCASVRAGNAIGGGDFSNNRLIPDIVRSFYEKKALILKNPKSVRPWQHVLEPLSGYLGLGLILLNSNKKFDLPSWNFSPDIKKLYTVEYIINEIKTKFFKNLKIKIKKNNKVLESKLLLLNNEKSKLELGWKPVLSFNQTLEYTFDWYIKLKSNKKNMDDFSLYQIEEFTNIDK